LSKDYLTPGVLSFPPTCSIRPNDGEIGYDGEEKNIKRRWLKKKEAESLQVSLGV
jgi:hypothetical protein